MDRNRPEKFAIKLLGTNFGNWLIVSPSRVYLSLFIFLIVCNSIFWLTAWWSPWLYILFNIFGVWFGGGIFSPWGKILEQGMNHENYDLNILKIAVPFIAVNWASVFACLFMLGKLTENNVPLKGTWNYFYYSILTLTTVGNGDVKPVGVYTEMLVALESLIGFIGFAIIVGLITSIILKKYE